MSDNSEIFYKQGCPINNFSSIVRKIWDLNTLETILIRAIIASAIECMASNQGRIFIASSGGLDSSFCIAVIRNYLGNFVPIDTFTVGSENNPDLKFAKLISEQFNTKHHCIIPSKKNIRDASRLKKENPILFKNEEGVTGLGPFFLLKSVAAYRKKLRLNEVFGNVTLIVHDGIDELLGGYWEHRNALTVQEKEKVFDDFWKRLPTEHINPLTSKSFFFKVNLVFPYLQPSVIEYISRIPVYERTSHNVSKIPLRKIAEEYLPPEIAKNIIGRPKVGFCDALTDFTKKT